MCGDIDKHTSLLPIKVYLDIGLFKRAPLEVLLVTTTFHVPPRTLLTSWLLFAALESLRFARHTACKTSLSARSSRIFAVSHALEVGEYVPLRLLLCFGLTTLGPSAPLPTGPLVMPPLPCLRAAFFFVSAALGRRTCLGLEVGRLGAAPALGGSGEWRRKTEGEGMVMASAIWLCASLWCRHARECREGFAHGGVADCRTFTGKETSLLQISATLYSCSLGFALRVKGNLSPPLTCLPQVTAPPCRDSCCPSSRPHHVHTVALSQSNHY